MLLSDSRAEVSGYAVVEAGCPITMHAIGAQVTINFGENLTVVLTDDEVVEQFGEAWTTAATKVASWLAS
jgi:hypothetical protein